MPETLSIFGAGGALVPEIIESLRKKNLDFNCFDNIGIHNLNVPNKILIDENFKITKYKNWILGPANPKAREESFVSATRLGVKDWATVVDIHCQVASTAEIHEGCYFNVFSSVGSNSKIGKHCFIHRNAQISHDVEVGDFVFFGPSSTVLGGVKIGNGSFIGAGSVIRNGITIGENVTVGAGAVVVNDIQDEVVVAGNPARVISK